MTQSHVLIMLISVGCLAAESGSWSKGLSSDAVNTGTTCLDGSPGGFYLRKGDPKRWIVFHRAVVGVAQTRAALNVRRTLDQQPRLFERLGPTYTATYEGSQLFASAGFRDFTIVYAMYCDGGSWTGNVSQPIIVGKNKI